MSHQNHDSWGAKVPISGWIILSLFCLGWFILVFIHYYNRWRFISQWKYTTKHGVQCFYADKAKLYLKVDIEKDTELMLQKWSKYYNNIGNKHLSDKNNVDKMLGEPIIILFKPEEAFYHHQLGYITRKVYGISGWDWAVIGQGQKPVEDTAFKHELSHILYNNTQMNYMSENESHDVFVEVGV